MEKTKNGQSLWGGVDCNYGSESDLELEIIKVCRLIFFFSFFVIERMVVRIFVYFFKFFARNIKIWKSLWGA